MPLFVRKITKAKWLQNDIKNGADASADAITNCMKTKDNTLSVWKISNEQEINEAILAMVSSGQHADAIDIVCFSSEYFDKEGINVTCSPGNTPIKELQNRHVDIVNLSYRSLGKLASFIIKEFSNGKVERITSAKIKNIINEAVEKGRLELNELDDRLANKL